MTRLFLSLYLFIVVTVVGFFFFMTALISWPLTAMVEDDLGKIFNGPRYIVEKHLESVDRAQWRPELEALSAQFGYQTNVLTINEIEQQALLSEEKLESLTSGNIVFLVVADQETDWILMPIRGSDLVLHQADGELPSEQGERTAGGYLNIAEDLFEVESPAKWPGILKSLQEQFTFQISLIDMSNAELSHDDRDRLTIGKTVGYDFDESSERYYKRIGDTDRVLKVGPIPNHPLEGKLNALALSLLAGVFALMVFLWIRPLWRDLKALETASLAFGEGNLETSVKIRKRSASARIGGAFNHMTDRIRRLISSHKELTDAVSHELRTPISRMQFGIDMLKSSKQPEDRARYLNGLEADVVELESLVDELLLYSRLDRIEPELKLEEIGLGEWLTDVLEQERQIDSEIKLSLKPLDQPAVLVADPRLLRRALSNIIRNAYRYADRKIQLDVAELDGQVEISVVDDGPGIPEAMLEKVFEPFTRVDNSRNRESGGYGLGLAIVARICKWHDGTVTVENHSEGGALFSIRLPVR